MPGELESHSRTPLAFENASAATRTSGAINVKRATGLILAVVTDDGATTPSFTPKIQWQDNSSNWQDLWIAAAAITADTTTIYKFSSVSTPTSEQSLEEIVTPIPDTIRIVLTRNTGNMDTTAELAIVA